MRHRLASSSSHLLNCFKECFRALVTFSFFLSHVRTHSERDVDSTGPSVRPPCSLFVRHTSVYRIKIAKHTLTGGGGLSYRWDLVRIKTRAI